MRNQSKTTYQQINPTPRTNGVKKTNDLHKNGHLGINSRNFETRFNPRYDEMPPVPDNLPQPSFSESSNRILKERYLLKGGNLEAVETVTQRFWHIAYDIASADFDFGSTKKQVHDAAIEFYRMMVQQEFLPNSPTIMNAGKQNQLQYSACFVLPVADSLPEIFDTMKYAALIHQTGGGCLSGDSRVWSTFCGIEPIEVLFSRATADGRIGIRQGSGTAYDVSDLDIKTISMNPSNGETGIQKVSHVWRYDVAAKDQVVVKTFEGTVVQTSSWHPFMCFRGLALVEVMATDLKIGDVVLGPNKPVSYWPFKEEKKINSLAITPEMGWLIGFTLGDGSFGYAPALRQYRVRWFSGTEDVLLKVKDILSHFNINLSIQKDKRGLLSLSTLNQRFVFDLLEACGLEKFGPKDTLIRIPEVIAKSPLPVIYSFLAGLMDSDGYVASDGSPSYSSVSDVLVQDIAALVSLLGFQPTVKSKPPYGKGRLSNHVVQLCPLPQVKELSKILTPVMASTLRKNRLNSRSRKQLMLPLDLTVFRGALAQLGVVNARGNKKNGAGPCAKELNYWASHRRVSRDCLRNIAQVIKLKGPVLAQLLNQIADTGQVIKSVEQAPVAKVFYDLSVNNWNTYAAGQSGMVMIHNTGFAFSRLRPAGSFVKRSGGVASGPVSFLRVYDAATQAIKQGGTRRGANMGILRIDHPDVLEFIRSKSELDEQNEPVYNGIKDLLPDDSARAFLKTLLLDRQISNFNISAAMTDEFMNAYYKNGEYNLVDPHTKEVTGRLNAKGVFEEMVDRAWATGDPGCIFIDRINNSPANPVPSLGEIESTNPCVTADIWIHTSQGPKQVQDLMGIPFVARVNGENYLSADEGFFKTGTKEIINLQTVEGYNLKLTPNHLIKRLVSVGYRQSEAQWCEAGSLAPGDSILLNNHRRNNDWKGNYSSKEGYLIGLLLGDGTLKSDKAVLSVWDCPLKGDIASLTYQAGPQSVMQYALESTYVMPHRKDFRGWMFLPDRKEYRLSLAYIKHLAHKLGMYPGHKSITPEIEKTSSNFYKGFLRGLFDADGSVQLGARGRINVRLAQSNLSYLEAVQRMLLRLGIASRIYQNRRLAGKKSLPDGKGGLKEYQIKAQHELVLSRDNLDVFNEIIGFANSDKSLLLTRLLKTHNEIGRRKEKFVAVVKELKHEAKVDVFDVSIPGIHAFDANGIMAHNCGEQPLWPWDACNLGSINLGKFVLADRSDVDWEGLKKVTRNSVYFLDNVVQTNPYTLDQIYTQVHNVRRIGLGVMGWADMLFKLHIAYDSDQAIELAEKIMKFVNDEGHRMSEELAEVRGPFPLWGESIYAQKNHPSFKGRDDCYAYSSAKPIRNSTVTTIAPTGTISIIGDCSSGIEPVFALAYLHRAKGDGGKTGNEMRILTIANKTFTEIGEKEGFYSEGLAQKVMDRGSVTGIEEVPTQWQKVFVTAGEISPEWHVKMQAAFQKFTDNAVSKTINLPNSATRDDVKKAYLTAWETGCNGITVYRDGSKTTQVLNVASTLKPATATEDGTREVSAVEVQKDSFVNPPPRPMILPGHTYKVLTPLGEAYVTINRDEFGNPIEVFAGIGKGGMQTGADAEALGRLISLALRRAPIVHRKEVARKIVSQLGGIGGSSHIGFGKNRVMSLPDAIAKVIAEDLANSTPEEVQAIPMALVEDNQTQDESSTTVGQQLQLDEVGRVDDVNQALLKSGVDLCPECGNATYVREDGCYKCYSCGYSKC